MSKFIMGFQIFFVFVLFIGIKVEANPISPCMKMVDFKRHINEFIYLSKEDQLDLICTNITSFFECVNNVMVEQTGYNLRQLATGLSGTEEGKALQLMVNIQDLFVEFCTEGTELHEDYMSDIQCNVNMTILEECEDHAKDAYKTFKELQTEAGETLEEFDEPCVITAYQMGCLGDDIREECGDEAYTFYKRVLKKIGFFKIGLCSPDLVNTLKTSFLNSMNLSESRKDVYRQVLDMKKRRK